MFGLGWEALSLHYFEVGMSSQISSAYGEGRNVIGAVHWQRMVRHERSEIDSCLDFFVLVERLEPHSLTALKPLPWPRELWVLADG